MDDLWRTFANAIRELPYTFLVNISPVGLVFPFSARASGWDPIPGLEDGVRRNRGIPPGEDYFTTDHRMGGGSSTPHISPSFPLAGKGLTRSGAIPPDRPWLRGGLGIYEANKASTINAGSTGPRLCRCRDTSRMVSYPKVGRSRLGVRQTDFGARKLFAMEDGVVDVWPELPEHKGHSIERDI